MKKLLMLVLIGLLIALGIFIVMNGFEVAKVEVLSYTGIQNRNEELDKKIQEASKLAEKDFRKSVSEVQESSKKLEQVKKEYEDMTALNEDGAQNAVTQLERYEVETLWVKLGKYATSEGAIIRIDVVQGNTNETYNLRFIVNGSYISITDFISDIENDSTLGFKIEEFKMMPTNQDEVLQAVFTCKEIGIKDVSKTTITNTMTDTQIMDSTNTTNTINNTTTSTSNTTNTNTTNMTTSTNTTRNSTNTTIGNTNVAQ